MRRTRPDGSRRFEPRALDDLTAAILVSIGADPLSLPAGLQAVLLGFAQRAGVRGGMDRAEMLAAIDAYFAASPLPPELLASFHQELRHLRAASDPRALDRRFARFMAEVDGPRLGEGEAREGVVGRGPLGFFLAHEKLKK